MTPGGLVMRSFVAGAALEKCHGAQNVALLTCISSSSDGKNCIRVFLIL
jgi:hypothetical protein